MGILWTRPEGRKEFGAGQLLLDWYGPISPQDVGAVAITFAGEDSFIPFLPATYLDNLVTRLPKRDSSPYLDWFRGFFSRARSTGWTSHEALYFHIGRIVDADAAPRHQPEITTFGVLWGSRSSRTLGLNVNWRRGNRVVIRGSGAVAKPGFPHTWAWVIDLFRDDQNLISELVDGMLDQLDWYEANGTAARDRGKAPFETCFERLPSSRP